MMPLMPLTKMLGEKISDYLQATGSSLEQLAEKADVPSSTLRRFTRDDSEVGCSLYTAFLILTYVASSEASELLKAYYPETSVELDRIPVKHGNRDAMEQKKEEVKKSSETIRTVFKSVHHYRLYAWILAGTSRENIIKKFGEDGLSILEEFVNAQVVVVLSDGSIFPIVEDTVVMTQSDLKRQVELNVEMLDSSSREAVIWTRMANLNSNAASEVRSIMVEARRRIREIMTDESNSGALPMHLTLISDFVH